MENTPRIAMVAYTFFEFDARVKRHVSALTEAGFAVDILSLRHPKAAQETDSDGIRHFRLRERRYNRQNKGQFLLDYTLFMFSCLWCLLRNHFSGNPYSLIHINNMPNYLIFAALPLRLFGTPVILDIHDTMPEIYQGKFGVGPRHFLVRLLLLEEWLCMKLASFVITTEHTKWERLQKNGLRADRSVVTLNLPDPALFSMMPLPEIPPDQETGTFRMVYHGAIAYRLGLDLAIRAVAILRDRIPGIRLEIIGDGEQREELIELTREIGLEDVVSISECAVPTEEIPALVAGAALAVVPSRNTVSTSLMLPTKVLEYIRLGIPCVTVATPTITRYFQEPAVSFAPSEDPQGLAEVILRLYERPDLRLESIRAARRFFETHSFESERAAYIGVVRRLVGERKSLVSP